MQPQSHEEIIVLLVQLLTSAGGFLLTVRVCMCTRVCVHAFLKHF